MEDFFEALFGGDDATGQLLISRISGRKGRGIDTPQFFAWPAEREAALNLIAECQQEDVYFSPVLYSTDRATKTNAAYASCVWTDADLAAPDTFKLEPTIQVETSPGRWQCYWLIVDDVEVEWAEAMSRAVTYSNLEHGADKGGWARNKLLRVPGTRNTKPEYGPDFPTVELTLSGQVYSIEDMESAFGLPDAFTLEQGETPLPDTLPDKAEVLKKLPHNPDVVRMMTQPPLGPSWHETIYRLECDLFRAGLTAPEVFVLVHGCACDKYTRDGRPETDLWKEILRAEAEPDLQRTPESRPTYRPKPEQVAPLLPPEWVTPDERATIKPTYIDEYVEWAKTKTNADHGYHRFGAMSLMATVLSDFGHATPSWGKLRLNLYVMMLGVTTGTYKTTAKNLMTQVLRPLEETDGYEYEIGGDATTEGLLVELGTRPDRSALFIRDEVQQMFEDGKGGKSWLGGLATTFTELYDGHVRGRLRSTGMKKTPPVDTSFSMYMMGVPDRVTRILDAQDFASGFLARILYYVGTPEPQTRETVKQKQAPVVRQHELDQDLNVLREKLAKVRWYWAQKTAPGVTLPIRCSSEAWERYNNFLWDSADEAERSDNPTVIGPSVNRMTKSVLKLATLLAMMEEKEEVSELHMLTAIQYAEGWYVSLLQISRMIDSNEWSGKMRELQEFVIKKGRSTWAQAYRKFPMQTREFRDLVIACQDAEMLITTVDVEGQRWLEVP